jgi:hypothetical protein
MAEQSTGKIPPVPSFHLRAILPTLFLDVAAPILIFDLLTARGVPVLWALAAGGLAPALNNLRNWIKTRRLEPLGVIVLTFLVIGTILSLISGSIFFALIKDSFLTGTFGLIYLGSLFAARPLMFSVIRQFVAGDDPERVAWWNSLWEKPRFRAAIRFVTAVWGVAYLAEATLRVGLALVLTPRQVVTISPFLIYGMLVLLIVWTRAHMLALGRAPKTQPEAARVVVEGR